MYKAKLIELVKAALRSPKATWYSDITGEMTTWICKFPGGAELQVGRFSSHLLADGQPLVSVRTPDEVRGRLDELKDGTETMIEEAIAYLEGA